MTLVHRDVMPPPFKHVHSPRNSIRAVTFDVGGTLIQPWPSVGHIYADVAAAHGFKGISPEILNNRFAAQWRASVDFQHTRAQWAALVDATFQGLVESLPSGTLFNALYQRFAEPDAWCIYPDVLRTLQALGARGLKLAAISNWDERLAPLLEKLGLRKFFEVIVVSCDAGCSKPSPSIFSATASQLGLAPELILHVGDSPEMDVQGARAAGFQTLLLDRKPSPPSADRIQSLHGVIRFLDVFGGSAGK